MEESVYLSHKTTEEHFNGNGLTKTSIFGWRMNSSRCTWHSGWDFAIYWFVLWCLLSITSKAECIKQGATDKTGKS